MVAIWNTYWIEYLRLGILTLFGDVIIRISQPYILGLLLNYYNPKSTTTKEQALEYAGLIVVLNTISSFIRNQFNMNSMHAGMRARASVSSLIYRKVSSFDICICKVMKIGCLSALWFD